MVWYFLAKIKENWNALVTCQNEQNTMYGRRWKGAPSPPQNEGHTSIELIWNDMTYTANVTRIYYELIGTQRKIQNIVDGPVIDGIAHPLFLRLKFKKKIYPSTRSTFKKS